MPYAIQDNVTGAVLADPLHVQISPWTDDWQEACKFTNFSAVSAKQDELQDVFGHNVSIVHMWK